MCFQGCRRQTIIPSWKCEISILGKASDIKHKIEAFPLSLKAQSQDEPVPLSKANIDIGISVCVSLGFCEENTSDTKGYGGDDAATTVSVTDRDGGPTLDGNDNGHTETSDDGHTKDGDDGHTQDGEDDEPDPKV